MSRVIAIFFLLIGIGGLGLFGLWLFLMGLDLAPERNPFPLVWSFSINSGLLLLFAFQHSGMARLSFKRRWLGIVPSHLERSVYVACSGLVLGILVLVWQPVPGNFFWRFPLWFSAFSLLGGIGVAWVTLYFDGARLLGLRQVWEPITKPALDTLKIVGPYRFVRHPLMSATLVFLWGHAVMSPSLFFLCTGLTLYIFVGIRFEEQDLQKKFGQPYADYRKQVPALIPCRRGVPKAIYSPLI